jgi:hypothetical protein
MKAKTTITVFNERIPDYDPAPDSFEAGRLAYLTGEVYYSKGGPNYFSGGTMARGYYVSVMKSLRDETRGITSTSFTIGAGPATAVKAFVAHAKAFSAKKLEAMATDDAALARLGELKALVLSRLAEKKMVDATSTRV